MTSITRKIYKRGNSLETTLPKHLFLGKDVQKTNFLFFKFINNKWFLSFDEKSIDNINVIKRKIYKRSSSFEITIPKQILFNLNLKKSISISFTNEKNIWSIELKNE